MYSLLIKLASNYDRLGQTNKADRLDRFLQKIAQEDREPTPEELMEEEKWLQDEMEGQQEDPLEGLSGEDKDVAELYLGGTPPEDIQETLRQIKEEQQEILSQLSQLLQDSHPVAEASMISKFKKLADLLDQNNLHKQADTVDRMLTKLAQGLPPDDDDDFEWDDVEPTTDELMELENEPGGYQYRFLEVVQALAEGLYDSLEEAQEEAKEALALYDQEFGMPGEMPGQLPENVSALPVNSQFTFQGRSFEDVEVLGYDDETDSFHLVLFEDNDTGTPVRIMASEVETAPQEIQKAIHEFNGGPEFLPETPAPENVLQFPRP